MRDSPMSIETKIWVTRDGTWFFRESPSRATGPWPGPAPSSEIEAMRQITEWRQRIEARYHVMVINLETGQRVARHIKHPGIVVHAGGTADLIQRLIELEASMAAWAADVANNPDVTLVAGAEEKPTT